MRELMAEMLGWLPLTGGALILVLCAPTRGRKFRTFSAAVLATGAIVALVFAVMNRGTASELAVINHFINPDKGAPVPFVVETVQAPGWYGPLVGAAFLLLPATLLFLLRQRKAEVPCPVQFSIVVTVWTFAARLCLEKCAAPEALTWSTGVTIPMLLMLPFVGWWSGAKNSSVGKFALILLLLGIAQRSLVVGWGFLATKYGLGTHLDVGAIRELTLLTDDYNFTGSGDQTTYQWSILILIPQYLLWIPFTLVCGAILGGLPFAVARRRCRGQ